MPHNNIQRVKRCTSYFYECPCGYSSICGSPGERDLKRKLHRKRCEKRIDLQMGCERRKFTYDADKSVLNSVVDKKRVYCPEK